MPKSSSKKDSDIAPLILPAAAIVVLYTMWTILMPPTIGKEIANLQQQLAGLQGSSTSWQQVEAIRTEIAKTNEQLDLERKKLQATQLQAQNHCGNEIAAVDQLETMGNLDGVMQRQGLMITADRTLRDRSKMHLAATLDTATRHLLDEIQKSQAASKTAQTRYIPANLPPDLGPEDFYAAQQSSGRRRSNGPDVQLREVELLGTYHAMLSALDQLNEHCGNSLVIGVSVRRPETLTSADSLRLWKLQLQVRPTPPDLPAEPAEEADPVQLAAE